MAASASSMPFCSPESSQPPAPAILDNDSWACWPRIKRHRVILVLSIGIGFVNVVCDARAGDFVERFNLLCGFECFNWKAKFDEVVRPNNEAPWSSNDCPSARQLKLFSTYQYRSSF